MRTGNVLHGELKSPARSAVNLLQCHSEALVRQVLAPTMADFQFGRNPVRAIVEEGLTGCTDSALLKNIQARAQQYGRLLDARLRSRGAANKAVNVAQAVESAVAEHLRRARQVGSHALVAEMEGFRTTTTREKFRRPQQTAKLQRDILDSARIGHPESPMNLLKADVYRSIDAALDEQVPGASALIARYEDLLTAQRMMDRVMKTGRGASGQTQRMLMTLFTGTFTWVGTENLLATVSVATGGLLADLTGAKTGFARLVGRRSKPGMRPIPEGEPVALLPERTSIDLPAGEPGGRSRVTGTNAMATAAEDPKTGASKKAFTTESEPKIRGERSGQVWETNGEQWIWDGEEWYRVID